MEHHMYAEIAENPQICGEKYMMYNSISTLSHMMKNVSLIFTIAQLDWQLL